MRQIPNANGNATQLSSDTFCFVNYSKQERRANKIKQNKTAELSGKSSQATHTRIVHLNNWQLRIFAHSHSHFFLSTHSIQNER